MADNPFPIPDDLSFEDKLEAIAEAAQGVCRRDGHLDPMVVGFTQGGTGIAIKTVFYAHEDYRLFVASMRRILRQHGIIEYFFFSSIWTIDPNILPLEGLTLEQLEERPDKIEGLIVLGVKAGKKDGVMFKIARDPVTQNVVSCERIEDRGDVCVGPFAELLPEPDPRSKNAENN